MNLRMFNGNDLPYEFLLTTRQKTKLRNAFNSNMSTDLKLSKAQTFKILQSGGFLGSLLSKLAGPLRITAAASAIDAGIQKKIYGSGTKSLIFPNKEMNDIMKIVPALKDSNILFQTVTETIKNEKNNKEVAT